ncbi:MarR family transcriptional regulator [Marinomonas ostreistagni]|uniref:MarR family transcriptional regulator n=1 Tax=Marinomonas ostreistagni TaxID=359209 RepID=UPI0019503090|nr:MarR family transcriptional regulator [Marinomonas ostreistagni]MBM6549473.1 MarR family transcriptional regulator [Marinomonas ostreistagni]
MDQNIGWNLARAALNWRHVVDDRMAQIGFTQSKWIAMMHLNRLGEGCTQSDLANTMGIEQPSVIRTLNQLEQAGFIKRKESPSDARRKTLWFTDAGKTQLIEMQQMADEGRAALLNGLSTEQRELLDDALLTIISNAQTMSRQN